VALRSFNLTRGNGPLWFCAAILGCLVLLRAVSVNGQPFGDSAAHAGMVSRTGSMTVMTADAGNEDVLVMLDERGEYLYVYRTDTRTGVQLMQRLPLGQLFTDARARNLGRP